MSIEELLLSAEEHGKRTEMLNEVTRLRETEGNLPLQQLYELAYRTIIKT